MQRIQLDKKPVTMKLSREARELIATLGQKHGMKGTAVVESAVRRMAIQDNVQFIGAIGSQQPLLAGRQEQRQTEEAKPFYETATPEEWCEAFLGWAEGHADLPQLPVQTYDRAYFYEDGR
jgi:hypothetical protein